MSIWSDIINFILPPRCLKCGIVLNHSDGLCPDCFNEIDFISRPYCQRCGLPFENLKAGSALLCPQCVRDKHPVFRMNRSAFKYNEISKPLILSFKFYDKTENAPALAQMMARAARDIFDAGVDVIIPVPLHYTRLIKRRYNQAALLAKELGKISGIPVDYTSVIRNKRTRPQVEFSGHARVKNVKNAFSVKSPSKIKGLRILLIDDVMTTGSTLKECALAMKAAGAISIDTLTAARVV